MVDFVKLGIYAGSILIGGGLIAFVYSLIISRRRRQNAGQFQPVPAVNPNQVNPYSMGQQQMPQQQPVQQQMQQPMQQPVQQQVQQPLQQYMQQPVQPQQQPQPMEMDKPKDDKIDLVLNKLSELNQRIDRNERKIDDMNFKEEERNFEKNAPAPEHAKLNVVSLPTELIPEPNEILGTATIHIKVPENIDAESKEVIRKIVDGITEKNLKVLKGSLKKEKLEDVEIDYEVK